MTHAGHRAYKKVDQRNRDLFIGFFYDDAFEVNPYIFESKRFMNVSREGLPICQVPFYERLKEVNYRSTYIEYDDIFFQFALDED